ncbi:MAG: hypothetical protein DELT_00105 [Desulfovibrio sp.]
MSMRITQNIMYSTQVGNMNSVLNKLYNSTIQSSSGLKINKPSDDPLGAARVIQSRATLSSLAQYQENISTATGWLSTADSVLSSEGSVMTILTRCKELAEQGASGTYTAENREQISYELRQLYEQLMTVANTTYAGSYIFSGQKTGTQAYASALGVTVKDEGTDFDDMYFETEGSADYTVIIQAVTSGTTDTATYRYSPDGGDTWIDIDNTDPSQVDYNNPEMGRMRITAGGVSVFLDMGATVTAVDPDENSSDNGTWFYIRPTAVYQGDDSDTQVTIPYSSTAYSATDVTVSGYFTKDVNVRIDDNDGTTVTFSYSTDSGRTWTQGTTDASTPVKIPVGGGYLDFDASLGVGLPATGDQFVIHPHRAEVTLSISDTADIALNLVGKDVFGGVYVNPATGDTEVVENGGNIFEIVGNLIAAAETNDQDGMGEALNSLTDAMNVVLTQAAIVGGRENRLTITSNSLSMREITETDRLSSIEDVDLTELLTRIAQEQTTYSAVLKTSSIIMQQSLLNYL